MTAPLDEKGLEAAKTWFDAEFNGTPDADMLTQGIIRAYLSAVALPDELEVAGWVMGSSFTTDPLMADYWGKAAKAVTGSDQAHSTIAALRAERDEARQEVARYWTSADMTPWVELAESKGLGHFGKKLKGMFNRAIAAEAQLKRLTEENEALRGGLSEERREIAAGQAWDFVKPGLVTMNQDKGPAGVWSAGFRSGWDAAARQGSKE